MSHARHRRSMAKAGQRIVALGALLFVTTVAPLPPVAALQQQPAAPGSPKTPGTRIPRLQDSGSLFDDGSHPIQDQKTLNALNGIRHRELMRDAAMLVLLARQLHTRAIAPDALNTLNTTDAIKLEKIQHLAQSVQKKMTEIWYE